MIDFSKIKISADDDMLICRIVKRAERYRRGLKRMTLYMDLYAVHWFTPLRLADLLAADEANFIHDISGITRHLDRETGRLMNNFSPRYARRERDPDGGWNSPADAIAYGTELAKRR